MILKRTSMILGVLLVMSLVLAACEALEGDDDDEPAPPQPEETPAEDETPTPPPDDEDEVEETPTPDEDATPAPDETPEAEETPDATPEDEVAEIDGEAIFMRECAACHGEDGEGNEQDGSRIPPHNGNPIVTADDPISVISVVLTGRGGMPRFDGVLTDEEIAAVVSYIRGAWDNDAEPVDVETVQEVRQQILPEETGEAEEDEEDEESEGDDTQGAGDQEEDAEASPTPEEEN